MTDPTMTTRETLDAYYYSFNRTGVDAIDNILAAVARAGKSFHNTEDWNDSDYSPDGLSPVEAIAKAAEDAAAAWNHRADDTALQAAERRGMERAAGEPTMTALLHLARAAHDMLSAEFTTPTEYNALVVGVNLCIEVGLLPEAPMRNSGISLTQQGGDGNV